jgi:flagellar biosynthesis/type III secretory pathway chaperone
MSATSALSPSLQEEGRHAIAALLEALDSALGEEFAALKARDVAQLEGAIARKTGLVAELESATGKYCRNGNDLSAQWPELRELAERCAQANRVNGGTLALNRSMVSRLLDCMHGTSNQSTTYSANGRVKRREGYHRVGTV